MNPQKVFLINSANKLMWHMAKNNAAQEEIFISFEKRDFQKILSNLTDSNLQLRLTSAQLIGQLLYNSEKNQVTFCSVMNIHYQKQSELILNQNIGQIVAEYPQRVTQMFNLIKIHHEIRTLNNCNIDTLIWFINPSRSCLRIQYLSSQQINQIKIKSRNIQNPEQIGFDPKKCIFGVLLNSKNKEVTSRTQSLTDATSQNDSYIDIKIRSLRTNKNYQRREMGKNNKTVSNSPNKIYEKQMKEKEFNQSTPRPELSSKKALTCELLQQKSIDKFHKHATLPSEQDLTPENRKKSVQIGQYPTFKAMRPHSQLVPYSKNSHY